jgi:mitochondrial import inner membrane translocase subunit TIM44
VRLAGARPTLAPHRCLVLFGRETQTVTLHKDSQWYQNWQNFKENNSYLNSSSCRLGRVAAVRLRVSLELFDLKSKYDESDHLVVRVTRTVTDKVSDAFCE